MGHPLCVSVASEMWAAQYNTWLLIELTPKGVVFSFSFLFLQVSWLQSLPACDVAAAVHALATTPA